ncbi:uncharacterized protein LOC128297608 [Anopheles moucheti]|uniref:uncharacterized protein LOC128297608 n=1 Tax=Anopheles moucheti TaxID=186751 RepID=UPI0022F09BEF|nr:uncharacterized protein LOC128297608 [Anopheles moucheti]
MFQTGDEQKIILSEGKCLHVANRMYTIGNIDPYVIGECFTEYASRIEMFFKANDVPEEKKVPLLVTMAGASLYSVAITMCAPDDPGDKSYAELIKLLKDYFAPVVNVVSERYKFRKLKQSPDQSINDYIISLKVQAQSCEFGQFAIDALRDQFVAGVVDHELRTRMLREPNLTLVEACEIARTWETAKLQTMVKHENDMGSDGTEQRFPAEQSMNIQQQVQQFVQKYSGNERRMQDRKHYTHCRRCGCVHDRYVCPAKGSKCLLCGKQGHVWKMCHSKKTIYTENSNLNQDNFHN